MPVIGSPARLSAAPSGCNSGSRSGCVWLRSCWPPVAPLSFRRRQTPLPSSNVAAALSSAGAALTTETKSPDADQATAPSKSHGLLTMATKPSSPSVASDFSNILLSRQQQGLQDTDYFSKRGRMMVRGSYASDGHSVTGNQSVDAASHW